MMEGLFGENIILLFFFLMISIYNYSDLKEYQRVSIIYITVLFLLIFSIIDTLLAIMLISISLFCFLEILTKDETKFKILVNPIYKIIDCIYISIFQYALIYILLSFFLYNLPCYGELSKLCKIFSIILFIRGITLTLQQKFVICSFNEMYSVFRDFPINRVDFNAKLFEACTILVNLEDKMYFDRKGFTFVSLNYICLVMKDKLKKSKVKIRTLFNYGKEFLINAVNEERGYSTIPMQLIRSLGIKRGYNYKYRRKIFEIIYSKMFFSGVERMLDEDKVANIDYIKQYYLYIYFHKVNTFLGEVTFSKFLNAFDMQYNKKNKKDIYDLTNEGIFIACMGLSKKVYKINKESIDYYLSLIDDNVFLDKNKILSMKANMMKKPYNGNYLK